LLGLIMGGLLAPNYVCFFLIIFSIMGYVSSRFIDIAPASAPDLQLHYNPVTPTLKILKDVIKFKEVWKGLIFISWFWFLGAVILNLLPLYTKYVAFGNNQVFTFFMALFSIGVGLGSVLSSKITKGEIDLGLVFFASLGMSVSLIMFSLIAPITPQEDLLGLLAFLKTPTSWAMTINFLLFSLFGGMYIVPLYAFVQQNAPEKYKSRVIACNNILNAGFIILASVMVMGLSANNIGFDSQLAISGVLGMFATFLFYLFQPTKTLKMFLTFLSNTFYDTKIEGAQNLPLSGPTLIVANHISFLDWLFVTASANRPPKFIIDYAYYNSPMVHHLLKSAGCVPIATQFEDRRVLIKAFNRINDLLSSDELLVIFPEGAISKDGNMQEFHKGVERIIKKTSPTIIPLALVGPWGSIFSRYPNGKSFSHFPKFWKKRTITIKIGKPVKSNKITAEELQGLIKQML
jgi:1-acyl-sn-glycerol-3-phosphate acyltransferase